MLLAVESSSENASLCLLFRGHHTDFQSTSPRFSLEDMKCSALSSRNSQRSGLVALLRDLLSENKTDSAEIQELAVHVGPGSSTGLRIGVALAQSFCLVHPSVEVHAVPLEALALERLSGCTDSFDQALLLADAQGGEIFAQKLEKKHGTWAAAGALSATPEEEVRSWEGERLVLSTLSRARHTQGWPSGWKLAEGEFPCAELVGRVAAKTRDFLTPIEKVEVRYLKRSSAEIQWERISDQTKKNDPQGGRGVLAALEKSKRRDGAHTL